MKVELIEHILYAKDVICISAAPGIGKTMLALQMLCAMTSGTAFLGTYRVPRALNVLYIQTEGDRGETLDRLELMAEGCKIDHTRWAHINLPGVALNDIVDYQKLENLIKSCVMLYDVIIIDPLYTTVRGSLKEDVVATEWIKNIRRLKAIFGCAIMILHHDAKPVYQDGSMIDMGNNNTYGSVFWQAFFNYNFRLKKTKDVYSLEGGKQRTNKIIDKVEMVLRDDPLMFVPVCDDTDVNTFKVIHSLKDTPEGMTAKDIIKKSGVSKATVYRIINKLLDNYQIRELMTTKASVFILVGTGDTKAQVVVK